MSGCVPNLGSGLAVIQLGKKNFVGESKANHQILILKKCIFSLSQWFTLLGFPHYADYERELPQIQHHDNSDPENSVRVVFVDTRECGHGAGY